MRTKEECQEMLKECQEKCDFWREKVRGIQGKKLEYPHQLESYENQQELWSQRVRTLEYVLGINEVI